MNTLKAKGYDIEYVQTPITKNQFKVGKHIYQTVKKTKPVAIHILNVFDFIFWPLVKLKGKAYKYLIYDIRDPWGVWLSAEHNLKFLQVFELFERYMANNADFITTVNRPLAEKIRSYLKNKNKQITIVPNYPPREFLNVDQQKVSRLKNEFGQNKKIVLYVGAISNLEVSGSYIDVIDKFKGRNVVFWFVGACKNNLLKQLEKRENVCLFGRKQRNQIPDFISCADVCVVPRPQSRITPFATNENVWKINEYLTLQKIVVASGVTVREEIPNLLLARSSEFSDLLSLALEKKPQYYQPTFWEDIPEPRIIQMYQPLNGEVAEIPETVLTT